MHYHVIYAVPHRQPEPDDPIVIFPDHPRSPRIDGVTLNEADEICRRRSGLSVIACNHACPHQRPSPAAER